MFQLGCCERKILFWLKDTVHVNRARVSGLASTSQLASQPNTALESVITFRIDSRTIKRGKTYIEIRLSKCQMF